jgi:ribose transport system permease protein
VTRDSVTTGKPAGGRARRGVSNAALLYQAPLLIPLALFLIALFMLLSLAGDASGSDLVQSVLETAMPLILVGLGQTLVILTGGIDLSVGGILSLATAIVATQVTTDADMAVWLPVLLVIGAAAGAINGAVIVFTRIQPFIVTLASWSIFSGIALAILPTQGGTVAPGLTEALTGSVGSVSKALLIVLVLIGVWLILRKTRFGVAVYAIGSSASAAELNGYNVGRGKILVYSLSGLAATLGGIYFSVSTQSGSANAGDPFILLSVAAVVIGGTSLFGGRGGFVGTVLGAMIIYFIPQIVFFSGAQSYTASLIQGLLLMLAIVIFAIVEIVIARRTAAVNGG